jgi:phosphoribosylamine--glycine ligase
MTVLLVGTGDARDHATFARLLHEGADVAMAHLGHNALLERHPRVESVAGLAEAVALADRLAPDIVLVQRPELLFAGAVEALAADERTVLGPDSVAAELERSKIFCKRLLTACGIATPAWRTFTSAEAASEHLRRTWSAGERWVVKSDHYLSDARLRTVVPESLAEAIQAVQTLARVPLAARGEEILLERREHGPELSLHLLLDGRTGRLAPPVSDYKTLLDGDTGPNTHGMGAVSGAALDPVHARQLQDGVISPLLRGLARERLLYRGVLYIGVLFTADGPTVLELNVRPGNPEWIALLARLRRPLYEVLLACAHGRLDDAPLWRDDIVSGCLFLTVPGYPVTSERCGHAITGLEDVPRGVRVFGEGVRAGSDGGLIAGDGRSLCLAAAVPRIDELREHLYAAAARIGGSSLHFRRDIGLGRPLIREPREAP